MTAIFLIGRQGSGKDTFADYIEERYNFTSYALADRIRAYIIANNPDYRPKSSRALEIDVGEAHRRWFGVHYWSRQVDEAIRSATKPPANVLIRDGRFHAEYNYWVNERKYTPVKLKSNALNRLQRVLRRDGGYDPQLFEAKSDCEIDGLPAYTIENDGTLAEFYEQIDTLMAQLRTEGIA